MALLTYADRVAETTTTTGTGTIQLGGAVDGKFRTFVAGAGSGNTVPYVVVHRTANEWEVGYGVVTSGSPDTLTRAGVYSSSNGGAAVNFSAGTKDVFLGLPAGKTVTFDDTTGSVTISGTVTATTLGGTLSTAAQPNVTSVGTLSSLTVSGNLTVDTNTLFVDAANNRVGVGTTSPSHPFQVGTSNLILDASGNLGIGVTPSAWLSSQRVVEVSGWSVNAASITSSLATNAYVDSGSTWRYKATGFATRYDNVSGEHQWYNAPSGTAGNVATFTERARITAGGYFKASNDGTYTNSTGAYHELYQTGTADILYARSTNASPFGFHVNFTNAVDNNTNTFLVCSDAAANRLIIWSDGDVANHDGVYGTISDAKLKQDITDANSQWDDLKAIRFRKYRFKSDVEAKGEDAPYLLGVVAQELQAVSPGLVEAHPDTEQVEVEVEVEKSRPVLGEDGQPVLGEDGEPLTEAYTETETRTETRPTGTETLSVKQSILLMKAAVALQEAMARIETLEARLAALEAK